MKGSKQTTGKGVSKGKLAATSKGAVKKPFLKGAFASKFAAASKGAVKGKGPVKGAGKGKLPASVKGSSKGTKGKPPALVKGLSKGHPPDVPMHKLLEEVAHADVTPQRKGQIMKMLKSQFSQDFPVNQHPYHWPAKNAEVLTDVRCQVWWNLYSHERRHQLSADQHRAGVSNESMEALKRHQYPLPFNSRDGLLRFCRGIANCIKEDVKHYPALQDFHVMIDGSGTSFYSENPDKQGHFFDRLAQSGEKAGDIDVGIAFHNLEALRKFMGGEPKGGKFGSAMWGSSASLSHFPSLKGWYSKVGNHPFADIGHEGSKIYNRDIGVIIYNFDWHKSSTVSKWWKKSYVYSTIEDDILQGSSKGHGKGQKGKGKVPPSSKGHSKGQSKGKQSKGKWQAPAHSKGKGGK